MIKILGIYSSASGTGKTTVARMIQNFTLRLPNAFRLGHKQLMGVDQDTQDNAFSVLDNHSAWQVKALKEVPAQAYATIFGIDRQYLESREWKHSLFRDSGLSGNEHFVKFAEGNKALFGQDLYVDAVFRDFNPKEYKIIIPDVRNKNEFDAIRSRGGKMLRLIRKQPDKQFSRDGLLDNEEFDYVIDNSYSFWSLSSSVIRLMKEFRMFVDEKQYDYQPPDEWHETTIRAKLRELEEDVYYTPILD